MVISNKHANVMLASTRMHMVRTGQLGGLPLDVLQRIWRMVSNNVIVTIQSIFRGQRARRRVREIRRGRRAWADFNTMFGGIDFSAGGAVLGTSNTNTFEELQFKYLIDQGRGRR